MSRKMGWRDKAAYTEGSFSCNTIATNETICEEKLKAKYEFLAVRYVLYKRNG
jgi:hypothetical protein